MAMSMADAFGAELMTKFQVVRREQTMVLGRAQLAATTLPGFKRGVICAASPQDLERIPDSSTFKRAISVVTRFRLISVENVDAETPTHPDIIVWDNSKFLVVSFDAYPQFGSGFYQAIARSLDSVDYSQET